VNAPYFPGYLFVSLNLDTDRWNSINGTIGVIHLLASGTAGRPTPLPPDFVEHLQFNDSNAGAASELRAGQQVRVIGGPLDHLCGLVEASSEHERMTILLSLLGKETLVSLGSGSLLAV
jgi:transcription antitermination factor NusG